MESSIPWWLRAILWLVAAQALLAHLFESCDIFEEHPDKVTA